MPPRGGGKIKLKPALVPASRTRRSFECGGPALDLLPGVIAVAVVRGPGGVTPELLLGAGLAKQCQSQSPDACSRIGHSAAVRRRNDKLNPAASSCECGGPALDLLQGAIAVPVGRGPGGATPESRLRPGGMPAIVRAALQERVCDASFASAAVALVLAQYAADRAVPSQ